MKNRSVFEETDVWGWVYGVPVALGIALLLFGGDDARGFGGFLLVGVLGSFLLISLIETFHNWLDQ